MSKLFFSLRRISPYLSRCNRFASFLNLVRSFQTSRCTKVFSISTAVTSGLAIDHSFDLTHESLIKHACTITVNAASTLLTTTVAAILELGDKYRQSLSELIQLLEMSAATEGIPAEIWDIVIEARVKVSQTKATLMELESYMHTVEIMVNSVSESAFLGGAEYVCSSMLERLESSKKEIEKDSLLTRKLEDEYLKIQKFIAGKKIEDKQDKEP